MCSPMACLNFRFPLFTSFTNFPHDFCSPLPIDHRNQEKLTTIARLKQSSNRNDKTMKDTMCMRIPNRFYASNCDCNLLMLDLRKSIFSVIILLLSEFEFNCSHLCAEFLVIILQFLLRQRKYSKY